MTFGEQRHRRLGCVERHAVLSSPAREARRNAMDDRGVAILGRVYGDECAGVLWIRDDA
jgi:hypothetical protein